MKPERATNPKRILIGGEYQEALMYYWEAPTEKLQGIARNFMERQPADYEIQQDRWNIKKLLRDIKKLFME